MAGRYDIPMPELTISPSQGLIIWLLDTRELPCHEGKVPRWRRSEEKGVKEEERKEEEELCEKAPTTTTVYL